MTIECMWKMYKRQRTKSFRNDLVLHYLHLARAHASHHVRNPYITYDELLGPASFGLIQAVEAYDPDKKIRFETFSYRRISGAIGDWLRGLDLQSRKVREFEKKQEWLYFDEPASVEQLADKLDISLERYLVLNSLSQHGHEIHLSAFNMPDDEVCFKDKKAQDPTASVTRQALVDFLGQGLPRIEKIILVMYYFDGWTLREIADKTNFSESRLSQLHRIMLNKLRHKLARAKVEKSFLV